ncbi:MAG: hypothetical protein Q4B54_03345, partial [Coriobacteriales bacterium]|nr:hypothetical protein [Coriobacteriales bacterium]
FNRLEFTLRRVGDSYELREDLAGLFMTKATGKSLPELRSSNNTFYLVGHSLGGAVVNTLSTRLSEYASDNEIFAYTYCTPKTVRESERVDNGKVFNVVCWQDSVTWVPPIFEVRNGHDVSWSADWLNETFKSKYTELTGKTWEWETVNWLENKGMACHLPDATMAYLLARGDVNVNHASGGKVFRKAKITCPARVEVFDSIGAVVGRITENKVDESVDQKVTLWVDGDSKYVYMPKGEGYSIKVVGTETGTMSYTVQDVSMSTGSVVSEKSFENVAVEKGKEMSSEVVADSSASATNLNVVDGNGNTIAEVTENGAETRDLTSAEMILEYATVAYDGHAHEPAVTVRLGSSTLRRGVDYEVTFSDNVEPGTAAVSIKGIGTCRGSAATTFTITWQVLVATVSTEAVALGDAGTLTCSVTGADASACSYQWQWSSDKGATWKDLSWTGAKTATLTQTVTAGRASSQVYRRS